MALRLFIAVVSVENMVTDVLLQVNRDILRWCGLQVADCHRRFRSEEPMVLNR